MNSSLNAWSVRAGFSVAAAALMVGVVATVPVMAAPPSGSVNVYLPGAELGLGLGPDGSPGKVFPIFVSGVDAINPTVVVDLADIKDIVTVTVPDDPTCDRNADTITCIAPDGDFEGLLQLSMRARAGTAGGDEGTLTVTVSADNAVTATAEARVLLRNGVDLVAEQSEEPEIEAKPGDVVKLPVTVANVGNHTAEGFEFQFYLDHGLVPASYTNCEYMEQRLSTYVSCQVDGTLKPDFEQSFADFEATVATDGYGRASLSYFVEVTGESTPLPAGLNAKAKSRGGDREFDMVGAATPVGTGAADIDLNDNFAGATFDLQNTVDIAAVGATAAGKVASTVLVLVGVTNLGKGSLIPVWSNAEGPDPAASFEFDVPPGTQVVTVPRGCAGKRAEGDFVDGLAGRTIYRCRSEDALLVGESHAVAFGLQINAATATGKVRWTLVARPGNDPANDAADVVINAVTDVVANPTPGSSGSTLPITGGRTGPIVASGISLLGIGVALCVMARRPRRVVMNPLR